MSLFAPTTPELSTDLAALSPAAAVADVLRKLLRVTFFMMPPFADFAFSFAKLP
jgi:hypothetical protein